MLRMLLGNLPGMAYRCTVEAPWTMEFVSEGVEELTGHPTEEFLSGRLTWADIIHPEDLGEVDAQIDKAIAERRSFTLTYRIRHASGAERWGLERGEAVYDGTGAPVALEGFISDITEQKITEQQLRESEEHYRHTVEHLPQMPWMADADGNIVAPNPQWAQRTGRPSQEALGTGWLSALHPDDVHRTRAAMACARKNGTVYDTKYRVRMADGSYRWVHSQAYPRRNEAGEIIRWYGTNTDIHEQVIAEERLRESEEHYRYTIELSPHLPWTADAEGNILSISSRWLERTGVSTELALGNGWQAATHPADMAVVRDHLRQAIGTGTPINMRIRVRHADGSYRWLHVRGFPRRDEQGNIVRWYGLSEDVHDQVLVEERIRWAAHHDPLTGLPNRALFNEQLAEALVQAEKDGSRIGLLLLDLDHLKRVNDTLGHDAGDALLKTFAERLRHAVRATDNVARLGGDEFAVMLPQMPPEAECLSVVEAIFERLCEPFVFGGRIFDCSASIGAVIFPEQGKDGETLLKNADLALYSAKKAGRRTVKLFDAGLRTEVERRSAMLDNAREALSDERIVPFYQPKIALETGEVTGFEALLRLHHPKMGLQPPQAVEAAFHDNEVAAALTERMIACVAADMRRWTDEGAAFRKVAVNAAAADFRRGNLGERILERLHAADIPPACFELEVTEHVFLGRGAENVERALATLSAAGVSIALDDFGTGYASLAHLKQFRIDVIKIDQSFIQQLSDRDEDVAIVRAVIGLGRSLGIVTVAEGIETRAQLEQLRREGCREGQGYLFSRAVAAGRVPLLTQQLALNPWRPEGAAKETRRP